MIPALFAGLAVAGVSLPAPALDAFERIGLELPNQTENAKSDETSTPPPPPPAKGESRRGSENAQSNQGGQGKGLTNRRTRRQALGPEQSVQPEPPGGARRRGPNPTPGTPPGKPDYVPEVNAGDAAGGGQGKAVGRTDGRGRKG
jgi:hypothetical protein